jgi:predicted amidohydrolase YtcJ
LLLNNLHIIDPEKGLCKKASILLKNGLIAEVFFAHHDRRTECASEDLKGAYVLPGFTDSHAHLLAHGIERQRIDLSLCRSLAECLEKLRENLCLEQIIGVNWDESAWRKGKKEELNKRVLDSIAMDRPVIMRRVCGHFAVCNSAALQMISKEWKVVDRTKGFLYEDAALYLNRVFIPSDAMYFNGLKIAMREANTLGITSIHEITDNQGFSVYQKMKDSLTLRVAIYLQPERVNRGLTSLSMQKRDDGFLRFMGFKIFMDGSIGARTAAFTQPYRGTRNRGILVTTEKSLIPRIRNAEKAHYQLMVHSIGDRATEATLNAFMRAGLKENRLRHRLEHLELVSRRQVERISEYGLIASMQPNFIRWQSPGGMYEKYLGARYKQMNCFKTMANASVRVVFGSDCMPLGPLGGIRSAVRHPHQCGKLAINKALQFYTEEPAYATFDEYNKGRIMPGQYADLVVF